MASTKWREPTTRLSLIRAFRARDHRPADNRLTQQVKHHVDTIERITRSGSGQRVPLEDCRVR